MFCCYKLEEQFRKKQYYWVNKHEFEDEDNLPIKGSEAPTRVACSFRKNQNMGHMLSSIPKKRVLGTNFVF